MDTGEQDARLDGLVSLLYDAALNDELWSGLAVKIAQVFDSTSTVLKTHGAGDQVHLVEITENLKMAPKQQAWAEHWHRNDLWVERSVALGMGRIGTSQELMPDSEFENSGFYQDWNRRLGIYHMVGAVFPIDAHTVGVLGIHRPKGAGPYLEEDRQRVARFLPHLNRALRMRQRLEQAALAHSASLDALERLDTAVLLLDARCRVLHTNGLASRILESASELRVQSGRLHLNDPKLDSEFARLVREAVRTASGAPLPPGKALTIQRPGRLPMTALVAPMRAGANGRAPASPSALVFMRDPERGVPAQHTLRELFGLTRTEAAIAAELAQGHSLERIGESFGIGRGTVRSHVKTILSKTGTHRQAQLVALISRSVASIRSTAHP